MDAATPVGFDKQRKLLDGLKGQDGRKRTFRRPLALRNPQHQSIPYSSPFIVSLDSPPSLPSLLFSSCPCSSLSPLPLLSSLVPLQDRVDDERVGVKSTARLFADHSRPILSAFSSAAIASLAMAGHAAGLGMGGGRLAGAELREEREGAQERGWEDMCGTC